MKKITIILILLLLALVQATILNLFSFLYARPDLLLISVIILSLSVDFKSLLVFALLGGVMKDIFSSGPIGFNTLLFPIWCIAVFLLSKKINFENMFSKVLLVYTVAFLNIITQIASYSFLSLIDFSMPYLRIVILAPLYTAVAAPLIVFIFNYENKIN